MDFNTKLFWATLDVLTREKVCLLKKHFGDLKTARKYMSSGELQKLNFPKKRRESWIRKKKEYDESKTEQTFANENATLLYFEDVEYPEQLRNIPDPPMFLFVKGDILPEDKLSLSVVGSRRITKEGRHAIANFLPGLIQSGFTIVSGMARGIDGEAHQEAIRRGGRTIAFFGTGIDVVYPRQHKKLSQEIEKNGALISEFPLGTHAEPYHFPRRNRLIAGFSLGTLLIEGEEKSGSKITASFALDYGKEVFAVPGSPFYPMSKAPNMLIKKGEAKLVETGEDILEEFPFVEKMEQVVRFLPENDLEKTLFELLTKKPMSFDEIVAKAKIKNSEVASCLVFLSMKGVVRDFGMNYWGRIF